MPTNSPELLLAFFLPGNTEWIVLLVLGLLIFGRRLPEVGRSIGQSIVEFKKGIKGIEDDIDDASSKPPRITNQSKKDLPAGQSGEPVSSATGENVTSEG